MSIVRGILTLCLMLSFIMLVVWLYGKRNKHVYDYAARLPLEKDEEFYSGVNVKENELGGRSKQA